MVDSRFGPRKSLLLFVLDFLIVMMTIFIAALAALQKFTEGDLSSVPHVLQPVAAWLKTQTWWIVMALTLLAAFAKVAKDRLTNNWIWHVVKSIVDRIAADAFKRMELQGAPLYYHRATLFRHQWKFFMRKGDCRFWPWGWDNGPLWPWTGWLVPVVRSGNTTQKSSTVFLASDDPDKAEGMAGYVWASQKEVKKSLGAPIDRDSPPDRISWYARETRISEAWIHRQLKAKRTLAASFTGIPIEVRGRIWGVLLLDSRDPNAAIDVPISMQQFAFVLGKLLERVST